LKSVSLKNLSLNKFLLPEKRELMKYFNEYIQFGGYPRVVLEHEYKYKIELIEELANSYIKKDVLESNINYIDKYYALFRIFASQVGNLVNKFELSKTLNISTTSIENYLYIMQKSFHIAFIKPFHGNIRKELTKMPKVYFYDLGLRNYFYRNFDIIDIRSDKGHLFENFIFNELLSFENKDKINFWLTQNKNEVDFIVNEKYAYEVKYNINTFHFSKYRLFLDQYQDIKFNVVYHTGDKTGDHSQINYRVY